MVSKFPLANLVLAYDMVWRVESHGTQGKHPESFARRGKPVPPPVKVNSFAQQGAISHVDNLKSPCGQTDCACGQNLSLPWTAMRVGVNTLFN